jgi:fumarate hydratase, class II
MEYRIEHDTMGEVRVPINALYRAQTQRAVENFPISGSGLEEEHIIALARIKKSCRSGEQQTWDPCRRHHLGDCRKCRRDHLGPPP